MDLRQLRHFLAVVEHGSILRAAERIHLTQPALSRSIKTLESVLGVTLLERGRRGIAPTPHGLVLARHARGLLNQAEQAHAALHALADTDTVRLVIGVGTHLAGGAVLARVVAGLLTRLPQLTVALQDGNAEDLVTALQRGELDAAVCAWPADGTPPDLVFRETFASDLAVVGRAVHPLARRRGVALAELAARRWALAERPRAIAQVLRLAFAAAGLALPEPAVRSTSMWFLRALLLESDLLALVPLAFFESDLEAGRLVRIRTEIPSATTRVGVLHRRDDASVRPMVTAFVEALDGEIRQRGRRTARGGSVSGRSHR